MVLAALKVRAWSNPSRRLRSSMASRPNRKKKNCLILPSCRRRANARSSRLDEHPADDRQHHEEHDADCKAPGDELLLDGQERLVPHLAHFVGDLGFLLWHGYPLLARNERWFHAGEKD